MTDGTPVATPTARRGWSRRGSRRCDDFVALARSLAEEQGDLPTDLAGWSVRDNVAHTAHLEAVLAGAPEETIEVAEAPHLVGLQNYYTEQGVLARRDRDDGRAGRRDRGRRWPPRYAELQADPPTDARRRTAQDPGWHRAGTTGTLLSNRPLDVWMHEQDVRRAVDRPGGYDSPVAVHTSSALFGRALPMVVGKRVAPPVGTTVRLVVPDGRRRTRRPGRRRRSRRLRRGRGGHPDATVTLSRRGLRRARGGRRGPEATDAPDRG